MDEGNTRSLIMETAALLSTSGDSPEIWQQFAHRMGRLLPCDWLTVNVISEDRQGFDIIWHSGRQVPGRHVRAVRRISGSQTELVVSTGQTLVRRDIQADQNFSTDADFLASGLRSSIMAPLISRQRTIGVICLRSAVMMSNP